MSPTSSIALVRLVSISRDYGLPMAALIGLVLLWELAVVVFDIPTFILPPPSRIAQETWAHRSQLPVHTWATLWVTLAGFLLSVAVGVPLAVLISLSTFLRNTIYPLLVITQSVPKVAVAPLIIGIVGIGATPKILVAFLVAFFPIVVDTAAGLVAVSRDLLDLSRSLRATKFQEFTKIRFPTAIPYMFSGFKVAITLAVVGAVVGEFVQADKGLGYLIVVTMTNFQTSLAFAAMLLLSVMGIILFALVASIERLVFPWHSAE